MATDADFIKWNPDPDADHPDYDPDGGSVAWEFPTFNAIRHDEFLFALPLGETVFLDGEDYSRQDLEREEAFQRGVRHAVAWLTIHNIWTDPLDHFGRQRSKAKTDAVLAFAETGERPRTRQLEIDFWRGAHHADIFVSEYIAELDDDKRKPHLARIKSYFANSTPSHKYESLRLMIKLAASPTIEGAIHGAPRLLKSYIDHHSKTAHRRQPRFALAGGLALVGVLAGRKYRDCQDTRTNFYNICVGPPAGGKDHSRKLNAAILAASGATVLAGSDEATSDSAIGRMLADHPARLMQIDEVGRFLASADPSRNPHLYKLVTMLQKLWSDVVSRHWNPTGYADTKKNYAVDQPHLVILGTTTPEVFYNSLGGSAIDDGMLSRVNIFVGTMVKRHKPTLLEPPLELVDFAKDVFQFFPDSGNLSSEHPEPKIIESTKEAEELYDEFADECDALAEQSNAVASLWGRAYQKARQFGLAYAIADRAELIDAMAARWGVDLAMALTEELCEIAGSRLSRSVFERDCQDVLRVIQAAPKGIIAKRDLCRAVRRLKAKEQADVLAALEQQELIGQCYEEQTKGRPKHIVFCAERQASMLAAVQDETAKREAARRKPT